MRCTSFKCPATAALPVDTNLGLCETHFSLAQNEAFLVGLCWNCGKVTLVEPKPSICKDRYLFAKGCISCTGDEAQGLQWLTFSKIQEGTSLYSQLFKVWLDNLIEQKQLDGKNEQHKH